MEAKTVIQISFIDFTAFLGEKGYDIAASADIEDGLGNRVNFPIEISFPALARQILTNEIPTALWERLQEMNVPRNFITIIKELRAATGWSLKKAKEYADQHFQNSRGGF